MAIATDEPWIDSSNEGENASDEEWQGFDDLPPPPKPLVPLPNAQFNSVDEAIDAANQWAQHRGYAVIKGRSKKRDSDKSVYKVWITCDRAGKPTFTVDETDRQRPNRESKKCECPMYPTLIENRISGMWDFAVEERSHNHEPTTAVSAHTAIRKMYKGKEFREKIAAHKKAGMEARHIYTTDEIEDPGMPLIQRDYYNECARIAREELGGRSPIQALLEALTEEG